MGLNSCFYAMKDPFFTEESDYTPRPAFLLCTGQWNELRNTGHEVIYTLGTACDLGSNRHSVICSSRLQNTNITEEIGEHRYRPI